MSTRRITLTVGGAAGALLAAAFLQTAAAVADAGDPSDNAFTIGNYTFDPGADGWNNALYIPTASAPPFLQLNAGFNTTLEVYGDNGNDLGSISVIPQDTAYLFGIHSTEFHVAFVTPAQGVDPDQLPAQGSVYDVANFGNGYGNVYIATPGEGDAANSITDVFVTPSGNYDVPTDFDAIADLDPGQAFAGLSASNAGSDGISDNAFTIGNYTFDPGAAGFTGVNPEIYQIPPALQLGATSEDSQALEVFNGSGTDLGSVSGKETVTDLFGLITTDYTVTSVTPADDVDPAKLPADGTVYSALNLGGGYENVYVAVPGADGQGATSITDTFVTPFGNLNIPTDFDATVPLDPGAAFTGLTAGNAGSDGLSDNAFTLGNYTFDPFHTNDAGEQVAGFVPAPATVSSAPLLEIADTGRNGQELEVYDGSGDDLGSVDINGLPITNYGSVIDLLGLTNTDFTITSVDPAEGVDADQLPAEGTVYDAFNFGGGFENVYIAVPGDNGATSITDTLVTPFGNFDLMTDFDATVPLDQGAAFTGLDLSDLSTADAGTTAAADPLAWLGL